MNIVVLGAGTVGTSISELLCQHGHSVTVVDESPKTVQRINNDLDVRALVGSASQSSVLFQAGISTADVCLAVTGNDEVNMVAASMAKSMGSRRAIARIYAPVFRDLSTFDYQRHFNIDRMLSLEHLSAMELARGIRSPGSIIVDHFARGELEVREVVVSPNSPATGKKVIDLGLPSSVRIGSIFRAGSMRITSAQDEIEEGDRLSLIGMPDELEQIKPRFQRGSVPAKKVVIAGGGEIGYHLARTLEGERFSVLLIESDAARCEFLATSLSKTTVVHADMTRKQVLEEERVGLSDVFVACTGDDENNIIAGVEAREIGAKSILAIVAQPDYANIVGKLGIDIAVSEREVMAKRILGFLNTGTVISRTLLPGGNIGVFEIEVLAGAAITKAKLSELNLPSGCLMAAIMRNEYVRVPGANDQFQPGDSVVAFIEEQIVDDVLKLFEAPGRP